MLLWAYTHNQLAYFNQIKLDNVFMLGIDQTPSHKMTLFIKLNKHTYSSESFSRLLRIVSSET